MSRRGWVLFLSLSFIWGLPYLFIRIAVESVSPWMMVFGRVALGAVILLPIAAARGELRALRGYLPWVFAFALVEIAIPFTALGYAEQRLTSSFTGLVIAAVPLVSALIAWRTGQEGFTGRRLLGLGIGILGVAALVGLDIGSLDLASLAVLCATVVGYALGPQIVAHKLVGVPSLAVIATALTIDSALFAVPAWLTRPADGAPPAAWGSIAVLGLVCTALAFIVFFALVREVGPARTTVITYLNPAVALVLGVLVLSEPVTAGMVVGFPLVILGSYLATQRSP